MKSSIHDEQYRSLAALRYYVRAYLRNIEIAANSVGLEYQQYVALLAVRAVSPQQQCRSPYSRPIALETPQHRGIVDRMQRKQLVSRMRDNHDHRQVRVELLPKGEKLLAAVVRRRLREVLADGRNVIAA